MEKVVIIGTGCAGLTAALYAARANLRPLVLTGLFPGGLLTTTSVVENYPGFPEGIDGFELMTRMQKQAERFGARVKFGTVDSVDFSKRPLTLTVDGDPVQSETVIIASGSEYTAGSPMESYNLEGPYFRVVFGFIGITDLTIVHAGGTNTVAQGKVTESVFIEKCVHEIDLAASK